ncbi:MAG: hypothetical protein ACK5LK_07245 [Chthoniobacterales bacterium]
MKPSYIIPLIFATSALTFPLQANTITEELEVPSGESREITTEVTETGNYILEFSAYKPASHISGYTGLFTLYANDQELIETDGRPQTFRLPDGRDLATRPRLGWAVAMTPSLDIFKTTTQGNYQPVDGFNPLVFRFPIRNLSTGTLTLRFKNNQEQGTDNTLMVQGVTLAPDNSATDSSQNSIAPRNSAEIQVKKSGNGTDRPIHIQLWKPSSQLSGSGNLARIYFNDEEVIDATNRPEGWFEDANRNFPAYDIKKGWRVPFIPSPEAYAKSTEMPGYIAPDIFDKTTLTLLIPNKDGTLRIENTSSSDTLAYRIPEQSNSAE